MKTETAIKYFGSQAAVAEKLGIKRQAVNKWQKRGVIPEGRAYQLEVITAGALKVDKSVYPSAVS